MTAERVCLFCGKRLCGRRNKRFCTPAHGAAYRMRSSRALRRKSLRELIEIELRDAIVRDERKFPEDTLLRAIRLNLTPDEEILAHKPAFDEIKAKRRERKAVPA
jgi:hypothetical protein